MRKGRYHLHLDTNWLESRLKSNKKKAIEACFVFLSILWMTKNFTRTNIISSTKFSQSEKRRKNFRRKSNLDFFVKNVIRWRYCMCHQFITSWENTCHLLALIYLQQLDQIRSFVAVGVTCRNEVQLHKTSAAIFVGKVATLTILFSPICSF